jgi:threonine dehydrogenase-like Zn-dependent dehydrogenase
MQAAAPGPIDCVLDLLPPSASPAPVRAAAMTVRLHGRVVLMGGVGMQGGPRLELPYPWLMRNCIRLTGQWIYPPEATGRLVALVRAGLLRLDDYAVMEVPLERVNEAVIHAAAHPGAFSLTVLRP